MYKVHKLRFRKLFLAGTKGFCDKSNGSAARNNATEGNITRAALSIAVPSRLCYILGSLFGAANLANGARWRSGYAEDCKSLYTGSIPVRASRACPSSTKIEPVIFLSRDSITALVFGTRLQT